MPQTITIASGKGGVGKTSIAVNLALMLQSLGNRTTLMDVDFGLANAHIMLGVNATKSLSDVINHGKSIEETLEDGPNGLRLLAGGSGTIDLLNISQNDRLELIRKTDALAASTDFLVIDAPAGAGDNTLDFIAAADRVVVVIVAEIPKGCAALFLNANLFFSLRPIDSHQSLWRFTTYRRDCWLLQ